MGNTISFDCSAAMDNYALSMSNGLTDVFIDYLLISGTVTLDGFCGKIGVYATKIAESRKNVICR